MPSTVRKVRRRRKLIGSGQNRREEMKVVDYSQLDLSTTRMLALRFNDNDQHHDNVKMPSKWQVFVIPFAQFLIKTRKKK